MDARYGVGGFILLIVLSGGCANYERKDLIRMANISLAEAVTNAETYLADGRAVEAELEREEGRTLYEIKLIDSKESTGKVYVDAVSGKVVRID